MVASCLLRTELNHYRESTPEGILGYGSLIGPNLTTGDPSLISNTSSPLIL